MTTLRVIIDQLVAAVPGGIGRYTEEITRALITTAPNGCSVEGIISTLLPAKRDEIVQKFTGIAGVECSRLTRRELAAAWRYSPGPRFARGMVHAPSLLAPLRRHDKPDQAADQIAVTIHDAVPWTHPETLTKHGVSWHRAMAKRAEKYADAIVVPTHAVAEELSHYFRFGDRTRVIGGAVSSQLMLTKNPAERAKELALPENYILAVGTLEPRKGLSELIRSLAVPGSTDLPLVIAGPTGWGELNISSVAAEAGLAPDRVQVLGFLNDSDLALVIERATVFVYPSAAEGFGLPILEAFHFGTPVVHSDVPALEEVAAGASVVVPREDRAGFPARLAEAITQLISDQTTMARLRIAGHDRAKAFSWQDSAEKVWQLHADL